MLWTIPSYDLRHYLNHKEDRENILRLKSEFIDIDNLLPHDNNTPANVLDVTIYNRFPGFIGKNEKYEKFYNTSLANVVTPPRGNLTSGIIVCGIAPGDSNFSFGEPKWLLGPSSKILHKLLIEHNISPYFTNIFKKPFPKNKIEYTQDDFEKACEILLMEFELLNPKLVIYLGSYFEYTFEAAYTIQMRNSISITHPSFVLRWGLYNTWTKDFKEKIK